MRKHRTQVFWESLIKVGLFTLLTFFGGATLNNQAPAFQPSAPDNTVGGIGIQLDGNGEAVFQITSIAEPGIAANAQIHVEIETGVVEGQPTLVETDEWITVVNMERHQATADFAVGMLGGDTQGGAGLAGSIAGGFLVIADAGALGKM